MVGGVVGYIFFWVGGTLCIGMGGWVLGCGCGLLGGVVVGGLRDMLSSASSDFLSCVFVRSAHLVALGGVRIGLRFWCGVGWGGCPAVSRHRRLASSSSGYFRWPSCRPNRLSVRIS